QWPASLALPDYGLLPAIPWDAGFGAPWKPGAPGEKGAAARLAHFVRGALSEYSEERELPGEDGTSRMSPWLHCGEISPRQIWAAVEAGCRVEGLSPDGGGPRRFLAELGWREFGYHLLYHFPRTPEEPLRAEFARFPWASDPGGAMLKAW